ncbi:MAG: hypothetical protein JWP91_676 [Fibrobacteres bacterium]|nr:hypothetical protein [Fibrobacterota bacterium]
MGIRILILFLLLGIMQVVAKPEPYSCGEKKMVKRPYGRVEVRVDCELTEGRMWVAEFKGEVLNGFSQEFIRATGKRHDSCFYVNGIETGRSLVWDSSGNILTEAFSKDGHNIGKFTSFFRPGVPAAFRNYDSSGRLEGRQQEWWKNGQPKSDLMSKNGQIISGTEYYPDGKPRIRYASVYDPKRTVFGTKTIESESWAPDGRFAGKVEKGQGEQLLFHAEPKKGSIAAHREIYKDSLMTHLDEFDSAAVEKWLKEHAKPVKPPVK